MRSTFRLFLAVILFTAVAGFASAQDASAAPPPAPPEVVKPVDALPVISVAVPIAPAVEPAPALTADQSAPAVEPAAPVPVVPPEAINPVTTTTKRVTKKTARKPADKAPAHASVPVEAAAPLASTAAQTTPNTAPPEAVAATTAPLKSIAPAPPAPKAAAVDSKSGETKVERKMGIGGWLIAGVVVAALFGVITLFRRRRTLRRSSIPDFTALSPELDPALVTRR